ncbi:MAG: hypothetical protein IJU23_10250 [Proteobacteria bacterium]|nr:hypothetical protein [Pseudomonadota bacterium]
MNRATIVIIASALLLGCADQVEYQKIDYCALNYQNCEASLDEDICLTKTAPASCKTSKDTADCIIDGDCDNEADESDAYQGSFDGNTSSTQTSSPGYIGVIDRQCHTLNASQVGGDVDILPIKSEPGKPLKIDVYGAQDSKIQPVLYLKSKSGGNLIYSLPEKTGFASLSFLAPDDLFYVSIEEKSNLEKDYKSKCDDSSVTGGSKYQYILNVTLEPTLSINNIGRFAGSVNPLPQEFTASGQSHYYMFSAKEDKTLTVTVQPLPNSPINAMPVLSPLSKNAPEGTSIYSWVLYGGSLKSGGTVDENSRFFTKIEFTSEYGECENGYCQYIVVVTDYEGHYGYSYQLSISSN